MFYPESKIYYDGSHYIAIPHTENPKRRKHKDEEELVDVVEKSNEAKENIEYDEDLSNPDETDDVFADMIPVEDDEVQDAPKIDNIQQSSTKKRKATRSEIFNELWIIAMELPKKKVKHFLINSMKPYFKKLSDCELYVDAKIAAKKKNALARKIRFIRKAYLNEFNYFVTFTYDDNKMDEIKFKKKISTCLAHFQKRKDWRYMGVWERAPKTKRLHFHGLLYAPEGTLPGQMIEKTDYNLNTHKRQLINQNTYFIERFGRNDFKIIDQDLIERGNAMAYILKYIEKSGEKIVYSRGLPMYFISDIDEQDVLCRYGLEDKKLLLADDFTCWDEGVEVGKISPEIQRQMRTSN